jgi:general stress protein 26
MQHDDPAKPLDALMEPGTTVMLGTAEAADRIEFRPMTVARVSGDVIEILLDSNEQWARALADGDVAYVTMSDNRANTWVSLRGSLSVSADPALIDELWNPAAGAFFDDGRDTPGIAVLRIAAERGAYWTSPGGRIGSVIAMVKAKLGDAEQSGEHGDVSL